MSQRVGDHSPSHRRSGSRLVSAIRQAGGLTQEALARELGVSFATVNAWERGRANPRRSHLNALEKMARRLDIRTDMAVLVIDDDPAACDVIEAMVDASPVHAEVHTATDPSEGLIMCGAIEPDLLLLDIMMPGIDGFDVARRLKSLDLGSDIEVVFVTASTDPTVDEKARMTGHRLVRKPIKQATIDALMASVQGGQVGVADKSA